MTQFEVLSLKKVNKQISRLHPLDKNKALDFFKKLTVSPFPQNIDIVKMSGTKDTYRAKLGKLRVIYSVISEKKQIVVVRVRYRKNSYRN